MSFTASAKEDGNVVHLTLAGRVDEFADFSKIIIPEDRSIVVNVEGLNVFNSLGIVSWIKWVRSLARHKSITFVNCSEFFVHKINFFADFAPSQAIIESMYLTYYCDECDNEVRVLLKRGVHYMEKIGSEKDWYKVNPVAKCTQCGADAEPEYNLENYFSFLERGFQKTS